MKIGIASDHRGVMMKQEIINYLTQYGETINYGTNAIDSVDYPIYAFQIGEAVRDQKIDLGILICGSGIGMSIAANKVKGVRCAKVSSKEDAYYARLHNHANVLAIASTEPIEKVKEMIDLFLKTEPSKEERHLRRVQLIEDYLC